MTKPINNDDLNIIKGGGGGGGKGGGGTAKVTGDNLDSVSVVKILDALGEGDIDGFATPRSKALTTADDNYFLEMLKDVFLDNTPVLQEETDVTNIVESDRNFEDIIVRQRRGTASQSVIPEFKATRTEVNFGNPTITKTNPPAAATQTITDASDTIDRIKFLLNFPQLTEFKDDGDITGSSVEFKFMISYDDGAFENLAGAGSGTTFTVDGRTGDLFQKSFSFALRESGYTSNIRLQVLRETNDATNPKVLNSFTWFSYTKILFDNNPYPNTALIGIGVGADQFTTIPIRNYLVRGLRTQIPNTASVAISNKNAGRITYTGTWVGAGTSGTANFINTWHSDPAWVLWDILTEERYGLNIDPTTLDEFSFLAISQYNNELVSDRAIQASGVTTGTWTQAIGKTFIEVTTTNAQGVATNHQLSSRDFLNCTFTLGSGSNNIANGIYRVQKRSNKSIRLLNVSTVTSASSGTLSFTREGSECRFSFNGIINQEVKAFDLINAVCSSMRVMPFWSAGSVTLIQDKPATQTSGTYTADGEVAPVFIFSQANVVDGIFTYEGTDIKNRATFVVVKYFDIEQRKASRVQFPIKSVFDNTTIGNVSATTSAGGDIALAKYGIVKRELNAFCCTSRGQAMRFAKYIRESEQLLTETVTFTVSIDSGIFVRCGHVIAISDRVRNGDFRRAGRIKSVPISTTDRINLDSDVTTSLYGRKTVDGTYSQSGTTVTVTTASDHYYEVGSRVTLDFTSGSAVDGAFVIATVPSTTTFTVTASASATNSGNITVTYTDTRMVSVVMPDNSVSRKEVNFLRKTDNLVDVVGSFQDAEGSDTAPEVNSVWILEVISTVGSRNLESDLFRVVSVTEEQGAKYKVTALTYNHSLYSSVDSGTDVEFRDATNINAKPLPPTNLTTTESLYKETINQNADTDETQKKTNKGKIKSMLALKWLGVNGISIYRVMYRYSKNNFKIQDVQGTTFELKNIVPNRSYDFVVQSISSGGKLSKRTTLNNVLTQGKTAAPNPVTGLAVTVDPNKGLIITWNENEPNPDSFDGTNPDVLFKDLDLVGYEIHFNKNNTNDVADANFGNKNAATFLTRVQAPDVEIGIKNVKLLTSGNLGTVLFFIKARDDGNRYSDGSFTDNANKVTFTPATPHAPVIDTSSSGVQIESIVIDFTTLRDSSGNPDANGTDIPANGFAIKHYEVLVDNKTTKIDTTEFIRPANFSGTKTFQIRTVDIAGSVSAYSSIDITVEVGTVQFDTPVMEDGFVLLNWTYTPPTSGITVKEFQVKVGTTSQTFAQASNKGRIQGNNLKVKQTVGTSRYHLRAFDVNDNSSAIATQDIIVNGPELPAPYFDTPAITIDQELLTVTVDWLEYDPDLNFTGGFSLPLKHYKVKRATASNLSDISGTVQSFANAKNRGNHMATEFKEQIKRSNGEKENSFLRYYVEPKDIYNNTGTVRSADITIQRPNNISNLETEVIDNNVLLRFSDATNSNGLPIKHYEIKKSKQAADGSYDSYSASELLGRIQGTFFVSFEDTSGDYRYYVRAVDVLGMQSDDGFIDAVVDEPPDFLLITNFKTDFDASTNPPSGLPTFINTSNFYVEDNVGYANVNTTETIQAHFVGTGSNASPQFATPQAQIDAGFAYWLMPTEATGHFQEILNLGTNIKSAIIKSSIQSDDIGTTAITPTVGFGSSITGSGSSTSIVSETSTQQKNIYGTNFQYVRFRYDFAQAGGNDLLKVRQIRLKAEVKQKNDQGRGVAIVGTGTYTRTLTTMTVTKAAHGLAVGDGVGFDVTSGNGTSGDYQVETVANANTFTVTDSASGTTNGNVDFDSDGSNKRGTPVFFNKPFVDIEAITATSNNNVADTAIKNFTVVDFDDSANPTKFHVFIFDFSDNQIGGIFTWQCRGR